MSLTKQTKRRNQNTQLYSKVLYLRVSAMGGYQKERSSRTAPQSGGVEALMCVSYIINTDIAYKGVSFHVPRNYHWGSYAAIGDEYR